MDQEDKSQKAPDLVHEQMPASGQKQYIRRNILWGVGLFAAALIAWGSTSFVSAAVSGNSVTVTDGDGQKYYFSLNQDITQEIETVLGANTIQVSDGKVYISHADCHNQVCVEHQPISSAGQTIVCLPHKLVVAVDLDSNNGADSNGIDGNGSSVLAKPDPTGSKPIVDAIAG